MNLGSRATVVPTLFDVNADNEPWSFGLWKSLSLEPWIGFNSPSCSLVYFTWEPYGMTEYGQVNSTYALKT